MRPVLCVDVGSTFTKGVLVDVASGDLLAGTSVPTSPVMPRGVLDGIDAVRAAVTARAGLPVAAIGRDDLLVCSSAGGGLRLAVVGYEQLVTAEAGHRVALSAGGTVVHVHAGPLDASGVAALKAARPDLVLLVGGTDGGNGDVLVHNARRLGVARLTAPVVVAGNADASSQALAELVSRGRRVSVTANVLPRIGVLEPAPARGALREAFLAHVIGGKHLARGRLLGATFADLVRAPTPDAVLAGVQVLAAGSSGDVLVVDVGGATTDVYSVVTPSGEDAGLRKEVVGPLWGARTVEGDLGLRWSAPGVVAAAAAETLTDPADRGLAGYAARVAGDPGFVPSSGADAAADAALARLAVLVAVRRHGRPATPSAAPRPLRDVALVVGGGGVLRHGSPDLRRDVLAPLLADHGGGWRVPSAARLTVDSRYLLFAAGLLHERHPQAAAALASSGLDAV